MGIRTGFLLLGLGFGVACMPIPDPSFSVLVFSKTAGYRHEAIKDTLNLLKQLGQANHFAVETTEDSASFTPAKLNRFAVVVFAHTTGDFLNESQQAAFEGYIRSGRGFVGIHAAADGEYEWGWYGDLLGTFFKSHPPGVLSASIRIQDHTHPSTKDLSQTWVISDEWYNFRSNPRARVKVLAILDETSYQGGEMGDDHPIIWCHEFDGGRSWYTGLGHNPFLYSDGAFEKHILGGILYASGGSNTRCT
jgi:type 1 glutamine amidotransferase